MNVLLFNLQKILVVTVNYQHLPSFVTGVLIKAVTLLHHVYVSCSHVKTIQADLDVFTLKFKNNVDKNTHWSVIKNAYLR